MGILGVPGNNEMGVVGIIRAPPRFSRRSINLRPSLVLDQSGMYSAVVDAWPSCVLGPPRATFGGDRDVLLTYSCRVRLARPSLFT